MHKVLFVSPHLDDAVFSCASRIRREVKAGDDVTVATVFSHARPRSKQSSEYALRRNEDRQALRELGARPCWLGLLDAPWRNPFYNSFRRIVLETAPDDAAYVEVIRGRLIQLLDRIKPDVTYFPLAVGTHIDHRLVFAAAVSLPGAIARLYYEDQPYALVRGAVEMRLREIGAARARGRKRMESSAAITRMIAQFIRNLRAAPYVRRYLPAGPERQEVETLLMRKLAASARPELRLETEIESSCIADQSRVLRALYSYRSQARAFLGTRNEFATSSKHHAFALGVSSYRGERYWKPVAIAIR